MTLRMREPLSIIQSKTMITILKISIRAMTQDSDDDSHSKNLAPLGSMFGSTIPHKIRNEILAGKYVEFSDLLPQSNLHQQQEEEYAMKSFGKNKTATYTRNQNKRNLPFFLWLEVCDIFTSIYIEQATSRNAMLKLLKSLLTNKN